jgi:hypothetical protein
MCSATRNLELNTTNRGCRNLPRRGHMTNKRDMMPNIGEGVHFDRTRRVESDIGFENVRNEYNPHENLIGNTK